MTSVLVRSTVAAGVAALMLGLCNAPAQAFGVDGFIIGQAVPTGSTLFGRMRCTPSVLDGLTACRYVRPANRQRSVTAAAYTLVYNTQTGIVVYVSRSVEIPTLTMQEVNEEIARVSRENGLPASDTYRMPPGAGRPSTAVIVVWNNVQLEQLGAADRELVSEGISPNRGYMIDFLDAFRRSAQAGLPVFTYASGRGSVLLAKIEADGRGTLSLRALDEGAMRGPLMRLREAMAHLRGNVAYDLDQLRAIAAEGAPRALGEANAIAEDLRTSRTQHDRRRLEALRDRLAVAIPSAHSERERIIAERRRQEEQRRLAEQRERERQERLARMRSRARVLRTASASLPTSGSGFAELPVRLQSEISGFVSDSGTLNVDGPDEDTIGRLEQALASIQSSLAVRETARRIIERVQDARDQLIAHVASETGAHRREQAIEVLTRFTTAHADMAPAELAALDLEASRVRVLIENDREFERLREIARARRRQIEALLDEVTSEDAEIIRLRDALVRIDEVIDARELSGLRSSLQGLNQAFEQAQPVIRRRRMVSP